MVSTKDKEIKALEKIKAIVNEIGGDDSYIGMAFKGCFDLAEENIANDFGDSWIDRWANAVGEASDARQALQDANKLADDYRDELIRAEAERDNWKDIAKEHQEDANATHLLLTEARQTAEEEAARAAALEDQIIRLKAKLYDLMTA